MRAAVITGYGDPSVIDVQEVPTPEPGPGQVRIALRAATVNPVDAFARAGATAPLIEPVAPPLIAGWDAAGTIDAIGPGVDGLVAGQAVIGFSQWLTGGQVGTHAEYVVLPADQVVPVAADRSSVEAATLPLNGLTAIQALDAAAAYGPSVLVTGAAGAVGGFAVELGAGRGLRIVGLARESDVDAVAGYGATDVVTDLAAVRGPVDAVIDGALLGDAVLPAVRDGGRVVTLGAFAAVTPTRGIESDVLMVRPDREQLAGLARADLRSVRVAAEVPFEKAAEAHALVDAGGLRGRMVLTF